jgi:hypothetical protein
VVVEEGVVMLVEVVFEFSIVRGGRGVGGVAVASIACEQAAVTVKEQMTVANLEALGFTTHHSYTIGRPVALK